MDFKATLKQYWGYDDFRGIQEEIIENIANGKDTLGLMPTGGGKSITFQVPALTMEGLCLVVTPLISLMKDQVIHLKQKGINAVAIHSGLTHNEIITALENCIFGYYKFLYVSPERLASAIFLSKVKKMKICFITIDEAHCISQWGYDFRPSYLNINEIRKHIQSVPILALTATATENVIDDIQRVLGFKEPNAIKMSFERKNIAYVVRKTEDKMSEMLHIIKSVPGSAIVYTRDRNGSRDIATFLNNNGITAMFYHAGLHDVDRDLRQESWMINSTRVIVATNAFGMGIDKPDVRLVVHTDIPDSPEAYFQEAGRAGRDGKKAYAVLLCSNHDATRLRRRIKETFPEKNYIRQFYEHLCFYYQLAINDGLNVSHEFRINDFCRKFEYFPVSVEGAIKILCRAGYINYSEKSDSKSRVVFITNRDELYNLRMSKEYEDVMWCILRHYEGLFSDYVFIDETFISEETGFSTHNIYEILKGLTQQGVLHYIPRKNVPHITFLTRRIEKDAIVINKDVYETRLEQYSARIEAMINYFSRNDECRSKLLLEYFGENVEHNCNMCDVCLEYNVHEKMKPKDLPYLIKAKLRNENVSALELSDFPEVQAEELRKTIAQLVSEDEIELFHGKYKLKSK